MKPSQLGAALLAGAVVYLAGSLITSPYNRESYQALEVHVERLEANVQDLQRRRDELHARAEMYRRSSDAVSLQARSMQLYAADEEIIRIVGADVRSRNESPGALIRRPAGVPDRRAYARVAALVGFLGTLLVQLLGQARTGRGRQEMRRASR